MLTEAIPQLSLVTDRKLKYEMREELKILWTYDSTRIEGNTLSLSDVAFFLKEGLTVAGHPLSEYLEVVGHANALDMMWAFLDAHLLAGEKMFLTEKELFALHRAIRTEAVFDPTNPAGAYKLEENRTICANNGVLEYHTYPLPEEIPALMSSWFRECNRMLSSSSDKNISPDSVLSSYVALHHAFVAIHPFADGNGRMARILANIPVLEAGFPPILIQHESRKKYIDLLAKYEKEVGNPSPGKIFVPCDASEQFGKLCDTLFWKDTFGIVNEFISRQKILDARRAKNVQEAQIESGR